MLGRVCAVAVVLWLVVGCEAAAPEASGDGAAADGAPGTDARTGPDARTGLDARVSPDAHVSPDAQSPEEEDAGQLDAAQPDAAQPEPDAAQPEPDAAPPEPDAAPPEPDAAQSEPDAAHPDAAQPEPDAAQPDAAPPEPDAAQPDAAPPEPDAAQPEPDAAPPEPDAAPPEPDAAPPEPDAAQPDAAQPDAAQPGPACDPGAVLRDNGCAGCHGPGGLGGLDLVSPGVARRLVDAASRSCAGRRLIDPLAPERSVLLESVGLHPGPGDPCVAMPLGMPQISAADQACLAEWVDGLIDEVGPVAPIQDFEATPAEGALAKVKTLLTGLTPTDAELAAVQADPAALRGLIEAWVETPHFERKLQEFLSLALQQQLQVEDVDQFDRLRRDSTRNAPFRRVMEESFVRTAVDIVQRGAPFSEVLTTRRWWLTTANLVLLRYPERDAANDGRLNHVIAASPDDLPGIAPDREWVIEDFPPGMVCGINRRINQRDGLDFLFGFINRNSCVPVARPIYTPPLTDADFNDWRLVELVPAAQAPELPEIPFYHLDTLRAVRGEGARLATRLERVGFFTTSVFLNNWATNLDNQFRVTTQQTLIGALHGTFSAGEPTEPLHLTGLGQSQADPRTPCYGCHRQLDPMRLYFANSYGFNSQLPRQLELDVFRGGDPEAPPPHPGFAFGGQTAEGGDLGTLAATLAAHPRFPVAWAQKLCLYANAQRCDEADPEFARIAGEFAGHLNFKRLVVTLFSSPLVTGLAETATFAGAELPLGITRRQHLCALLDARVEVRVNTPRICDEIRVAGVVGLIPGDDFARGEADFTQPNRASAFQFAAAEAVCEAVALVVVRSGLDQFPVPDAQAETLVQALVTQLMGLPEGHPRHALMTDVLRAHRQRLREDDLLAPLHASRAVFVLACLSPEVQGVGL